MYCNSVKQEILIQAASMIDIEGIIEISNMELGSNYIDKNIAYSFISNASKCLVAKRDNGYLLGFCYAFFLHISQIEEVLHISMPKKLLKSNARVAIFKTIAIRSNFKGKGVGIALINRLISIFKANNVDFIIGVGWESKRGINVHGIMKRYGFDIIAHAKEYWKLDSINRKYECPICGFPCECSAVFYFKKT